MTRPKIIKIDTEGAEQRVLEGMEETIIRHKPPFILTEFNPFGSRTLGCPEETLRAYMRSFGYDTFLLHESGWFPSLVPPEVELTHAHDGWAVLNVMFSTMKEVVKAYPKTPYV